MDDGRSSKPSVTVIINNFNYGHFLRECIESVLNQTRAPEQIIVVDDGSTDGSARIIAAYASRIKVVRKENGGQASAFNASLAAISSEIVIFLDSDDLLKPEAVEVVLANWQCDLVLVSFGLELIDTHGSPRGLYTITLEADDGDSRPRVLSTGNLAFCPTSGNAFSSDFLRKVLPINETRWKISADAYLIRAAFLRGRTLSIRQVLGAYRTHGNNGYYREHASLDWHLERAFWDIADVLLGLSRTTSLGDACAVNEERLRLRLRLTALKFLAQIAERTGQSHAVTVTARDILVLTLLGRLRLWEKVAAVIPCALLGLGAAKSSHVLRWILKRPSRPLLLEVLLRLIGYAALESRLDAFQKPRWIAYVPLANRLTFHTPGPQRNILGRGWERVLRNGTQTTYGQFAELHLRIDPSPEAVQVDLELEPTSPDPILVSIEAYGRQVHRSVLAEPKRVSAILPRDFRTDLCTISLRVRLGWVQPQKFWRALMTGRPSIAIRSIEVRELPAPRPAPYIAVGSAIRFKDVVGSTASNSGWRLQRDGTGLLLGLEGQCTVSLPALSEAVDVIFQTTEATPPGWLRVYAGAVEVFAGNPMPGGLLRCRIPERSTGHSEIVFKLVFAAADPTSAHSLGIASLGVLPAADVSLSTRAERPRPTLAARQASTGERALRDLRDEPQATSCDGVPGGFDDCSSWNPNGAPRSLDGGPPLSLNSGQRVDFEFGSIGRLLTSLGWHCQGNALPVNDSAEASLVFALPSNATNAIIALDVEPHLQGLLGRKHLIGVSANGRTICAFEIVGAATVQIPLPEEIMRTEGPVVLTLHSVWTPVESEGDERILPALISPRALTLTCAQGGDPVPLPLTSYHPPALSSLLHDASLSLEDGSDAEAAQLQEIRSGLALQLAGLSPKGLQSYLQEKSALSTLVRVGAESAHIDLSVAEDELLAAAKRRLVGPSSSEPERLRDLLIGMLLAPAPQILPKPDLSDLPKALLFDPVPTAEYLARMPALRTHTHDTGSLLSYAKALLQSVERVLRCEPLGTRLFQLAERTLEAFHPTLLLFGDENLSAHARLLGQCIETYLIRSGKILGYRAEPARADRVRLGVIVRDVLPSPEGWLLFGLFSGLKREDYEIWIISLAESESSIDTSRDFEHKLVLSGMSIDEAVATIRGLRLDVLACGSFFHGLERLTTLVAHRLAKVQVLFSAIAPMSSGLRNFDYVISSRETEPPDAEAHYTETVRWMPGSFQCFRFEGVSREREVADSRAQTRERIGVSEDAVVAVCGAMAQKIGPDLIAAWADLLNRAPQSVLVLYPFASNWGLRYRDDFDRTIRKSFDVASIARSRLVVLEPQLPEAVRPILRAADLYLDSFPYAGATTVVEALSAGLPTITLAGRTQRGLQGSAWVRAAGLDELVTASAEEYVAAAASLANQPEKRARLRATLRDRLETGQFPVDPVDFGSKLSAVLREITRGRSL